MLQNNVVYIINCPGCNAMYVGQMSRYLQQQTSRGLLIYQEVLKTSWISVNSWSIDTFLCLLDNLLENILV